MTCNYALVTVTVGTLFGMFGTPIPAEADHCTIAVTTYLQDRVQVHVPDSIYNSAILFEGNASPTTQEPLVAHGNCPLDPEFLFVVHNCTTGHVYEYMTLPEGEYEMIDGVPLYVIRGPFDDNFNGREDRYNC